MKQYSNENSGTLFVNDRKETDRHPDSTGSLNVTCPHCGQETALWLSAWRKVSGSGKKFLSLSVKPKDANASAPAKAAAGISQPEPNDDIPF